MDHVAANPLNPRMIDPDSSAVQKIRDSIAEIGQIQPTTVVTRRAFLAIHPEHESEIADAEFVQVVGGQRRTAVAQLEQLLKITIDDELAATRSRFLAATLAENLDRQNLNPVEEAHGVQSMVAECGSGKAAAEQLSKTAAWVSQRLNLLKLIPEVQAALVEDDEMRLPLRVVRDWHTLDSAGQLAALTEWGRQLTAVNRPERPEPATSVPKQRLSRVVAAIRRLGATPAEIGATLRAELSLEDRRAIADELLRDAASVEQ
ncbi:ParB/RepB/Spo0J family partition protein [Actinoplanes subglobosus]|uniref:ParB/RepB/Spo0J family partition protein n=1 Tax=Actinoplanes subglobosus TaxID=1547892 RepID=UPI00366EF9B9